MSVFADGKVHFVSRGGPNGGVMVVGFELMGQRFMALNGGPHYTLTPAVSFMIGCQTQEQVDYYWSRLTAGGQEQPCGWLVDRFGLSWQVVPDALGQLMSDPDPAKAGRVAAAMMTMKKFDIAALQRAHAGG